MKTILRCAAHSRKHSAFVPGPTLFEPPIFWDEKNGRRMYGDKEKMSSVGRDIKHSGTWGKHSYMSRTEEMFIDAFKRRIVLASQLGFELLMVIQFCQTPNSWKRNQ